MRELPWGWIDETVAEHGLGEVDAEAQNPSQASNDLLALAHARPVVAARGFPRSSSRRIVLHSLPPDLGHLASAMTDLDRAVIYMGDESVSTLKTMALALAIGIAASAPIEPLNWTDPRNRFPIKHKPSGVAKARRQARQGKRR